MPWINCRYDSAVGTYKVNWAYEEKALRLQIEVPFNAEAEVTLPWSGAYTLNGVSGEAQCFPLNPGCYEILLAR